MTLSRTYGIAAVVAVSVAVSACGGSRAAMQTAPSSRMGGQSGIAKARADSARYPYTAADIHFMSAMIGHHAQALEMARLAPTHGADAAVQRLAERVINAQQDEIAIMQQ